MKRIYLLLFTIVLGVNAMAQRSADLEVTLIKPTSSDVQTSGGAFQITAVVKNNGPDSVKMSDSTAFGVTLSGKPLEVVIGSIKSTAFNRFNRSLKMGDTMHININNTITYNQGVDSNRTVCFWAIPNYKGTGDTLGDPTTSNNTDCVTYLWKQGTNSVTEVSERVASIAKIFPNPASDYANITINLGVNAEVNVRLLDITGRTIISENKGFMHKGEHTIPVNAIDLKNGLYLYQIQMGEEVSTGKLMIAK